jgi:ATP-dependent Clp endopeptidase proteolytic subunit ClpP
MKKKMKKKFRIINGPEGGVAGILENQTAYNIIENEKEDSAEITMYGEVVKDRPRGFWTDKEDTRLYIVLNEFLGDLEKVKNRSKITVRINSPGGDLYAGLAIMNRLSELEGDVVTIVDGLAASAASIILQGGKTRKAHKGSMVMVHGASMFLYGSYNEAKLEETSRQLNAANKAAIEAYVQRTGLERDEIKKLVSQTEWMTGQEAVDKGFADELIDTGSVSMSISGDKAYLMVNGVIIPTMGFETLPAGLEINPHMVIPGQEPVIADIREQNEGGSVKMTAEELKSEYPELVAQIEQDAIEAAKNGKEGKSREEITSAAVQQERKRISEIEEIANAVGDKELLRKAKFETPMSAAELALEAMKKQANTRAGFLENYSGDVNSSNVNDVEAAPCGNIQDEITQNDIDAGAKMIAGIEQGKERA